MSALGDPLVDLGILLAYWAPTAPPEQRDALTTVTDRPGYLDAATRSSSATPRAPAATSRASASTRSSRVFKIAVVIQQIYYRYVQGQTDRPRFATFGARVAYLARHAADLAEKADDVRRSTFDVQLR